MQFMCMSVYPKNHKCEVENELWMVPLSYLGTARRSCNKAETNTLKTGNRASFRHLVQFEDFDYHFDYLHYHFLSRFYQMKTDRVPREADCI